MERGLGLQVLRPGQEGLVLAAGELRALLQAIELRQDLAGQVGLQNGFPDLLPKRIGLLLVGGDTGPQTGKLVFRGVLQL